MSIVQRPAVDPLERIPVLPEEPLTYQQEVLLRAAILIEDYGWMEVALGCKKVGFCLLGAVAFAAGIYDGREENATDEVYDAAAEFFGPIEITPGRRQVVHEIIYEFNDAGCGNGKRAVQVLRDIAGGKTWAEATA